MIGIVGYGGYVPQYRIKTREIANVWGEDPERVEKGLGILEKSVPGVDEDAATIAVEAARIALSRAGIDPSMIGAVFVGSESHPYAVKPTATIVAEALGSTPHLFAADLEFACKAGTAGIQIVYSMIKAGLIDYGLAIGADTSQGRPGDALEYSAGAGGGAFILGKTNREDEMIASLDYTVSYATDTPDFWRRQHAEYPSHGARFTGEPAYFKHLISATEKMLEVTGYTVEDIDYFVFHQPNAKFPLRAAKKLGIPKEKVTPGLLTPLIGNTYSGASVLGLVNVLDRASPGERILVTSFGSGAGSDSFIFTVQEGIEEKRDKGVPLSAYIEKKVYLSYGRYAKHRGKLKM